MAKSVFVTWDIDGTLVLGTAAIIYHLEAFKGACRELFGPCEAPEVPWASRSTAGWTSSS
jgi:hypothetical protein